mmetsp:Transcript_35246/g.93398  ORF Transcript_35246/g.93398 Transcript_35246/m.93398 type:complete len:201 (+) Transcript_35246:764-1366(+)
MCERQSDSRCSNWFRTLSSWKSKVFWRCEKIWPEQAAIRWTAGNARRHETSFICFWKSHARSILACGGTAATRASVLASSAACLSSFCSSCASSACLARSLQDSRHEPTHITGINKTMSMKKSPTGDCTERKELECEGMRQKGASNNVQHCFPFMIAPPQAWTAVSAPCWNCPAWIWVLACPQSAEACWPRAFQSSFWSP